MRAPGVGRARDFVLLAAIALAALATKLVAVARPASTRTDLLPVYSFNGAGLWLAKEKTGRSEQVGGSDRIGLWRDLQARMRAAQ